MAPVVGVLGGMGPLASAEFLKTIYGLPPPRLEQQRPRVVLLSDPAMPDRTHHLLHGDDHGLRDRFERGLRALQACGASTFVVCCVTIHALLPDMPEDLRGQVSSLVALTIDEIRRRPGRYLLLCSNGARQLGVFERDVRWREIAARIVLPSDADQQTVHRLIYRLKRGDAIDGIAAELEPLIEAYRTDGYVAGCTELHLVNKRHGAVGQASCVDPLVVAASLLWEGA